MSIILWALTGCGPKQEPVTRDEQDLSPQKVDDAMKRRGANRQDVVSNFPNINDRGLATRVISSGHDNKYTYDSLNLTSQSEGNNYTVTKVSMSDYQYQRFAQLFRVEVYTPPTYPAGGGNPDSDWDGSTAPAPAQPQRGGSGNPDSDWDGPAAPAPAPQQPPPPVDQKKSGTPEDDWGFLMDWLNPISTAHAQTIDAGWVTTEDTDISKSSISVDFMVGDAAHPTPTHCTLTLNRARGLYEQGGDWAFAKGVDTLNCNDQWAVNAHKIGDKGKVIKQAGRIHAGGVSAAIQRASGF